MLEERFELAGKSVSASVAIGWCPVWLRLFSCVFSFPPSGQLLQLSVRILIDSPGGPPSHSVKWLSEAAEVSAS